MLTCSDRADTQERPFDKSQLVRKQPPPKLQMGGTTKRNISDQGDLSSADSTSYNTDGSKPLQTDTIEPTKKKRIISDPRHFLLQTWWRPKKIKRTLPVVAFSLQQCVVENATESCIAGVKKQRVSRRLILKNSSTAPDLKLRCPICGREFAMGWLVSGNSSLYFSTWRPCDSLEPFFVLCRDQFLKSQ